MKIPFEISKADMDEYKILSDLRDHVELTLEGLTCTNTRMLTQIEMANESVAGLMRMWRYALLGKLNNTIARELGEDPEPEEAAPAVRPSQPSPEELRAAVGRQLAAKGGTIFGGSPDTKSPNKVPVTK